MEVPSPLGTHSGVKGEDRVQGQIELDMRRGCGKIEEREKKTVDDPEI